jgi:hypothetical protein
MLQCTSLNKLSSFKLIAIILFAGLILASCKALQNQSNIFENPVCAPPFWENITPGMTTKKEASEILFKISEDQVTVELDTLSGKIDSEIRFSCKNIDGSVAFIGENVSLITLSPKFSISLQNAVEILTNQKVSLFIKAANILGSHFTSRKQELLSVTQVGRKAGCYQSHNPQIGCFLR